MDDYTREMMDLKTLVTRTLEKKGVLARIRVISFIPPPFLSFLGFSYFLSLPIVLVSICITSLGWLI